MRIAIDAMGGDHAPKMNVEGAVLAAKQWSNIEVVLIGDTDQMEPFLNERPANLRLVHTTEVIEAEDEPVKAVRRKKDASMVVGGRMLREREVDAFISAGNTGALVVTGLLVVGRLSGIERPALAPIMPSMKGGGTLALDLGANPDASPENLLQYAIMGSIYRNKVDGVERPRVGLLNVGTEEMKGNELSKAAYVLLKEGPFEFIGNVEARDVFQGVCDVLVCDGFSGNIMLKAAEGTVSVIFSELKKQFVSTWYTKVAAAVLAPGLRAFRKKMDYTEHGAAPLLGIDGLVLKSHGSSDAKSIKNAVRQAIAAIESQLVQSISIEINKGKQT